MRHSMLDMRIHQNETVSVFTYLAWKASCEFDLQSEVHNFLAVANTKSRYWISERPQHIFLVHKKFMHHGCCFVV